MQKNQIYSWEIELKDQTIIKQGEKKWKNINTNNILRVSYLPIYENLLPRHDIWLSNNKVIKNFGRGFLTKTGEGSIYLKEYVFCLHTEQYKFWLFHNGRTLITSVHFELRV